MQNKYELKITELKAKYNKDEINYDSKDYVEDTTNLIFGQERGTSAFLFGLDIENKCWLLLGKYDLDMLVLTCGVNGSYVFAPNLKSFQETPKVDVADTVGAGDSFTGAFASAILAGMPITDAHKLAVDVSAYVCTQNGAMPKLPKELLDRIK